MTDQRATDANLLGGLAVSFEFFPPKTAEQAEALTDTSLRLSRFRPEFVSITYGAGGTSKNRSLQAVRESIASGLPTAAHLTCAGASRGELAETIQNFRDFGVRRCVALRGDPPGGLENAYVPHPDGYDNTADLVRALKAAGAEDVAVSAYPERHPQSPNWAIEIDVLKQKVDAGADRAITQFFFGTEVFEAYLERVRSAGISIPVVPGIMPITRFASVVSFAGRCGATVPEWLIRRFNGIPEESDEVRAEAAALAIEQIEALCDLGVDGVHFYTLNRAPLCEAICSALAGARGVRAAA